MVEPLTTTAATSTASTAAGAVTTAASGIAESTGNWFTDTLMAPFRWVGSFFSQSVEAVTSIPRNLLGAVTGAAKNIFSLSNVPLLAALTGAFTLMKTTFPEGWRDVRVAISGEDKATATRAIEEISKDGLTGIGFDSAKQAAAITAAISGITGAIGGGGLLAGGALIGGVGFLAYQTLLAPETPVATPAAKPAAKPENAKT